MQDAASSVAQSPFIPGTNIQFAWDSTSLGWLKACARQYQLSMIEGWRPKAESIALRFGILFHQALEHWDHLVAAGRDKEESLRFVVKEALEASWGFTGDNNRNRENLIRSIVWYIEEFKSDPLETLRAETGEPLVELSFRFELDWGPEPGQPYILCGHLDRIVRFSDGTFVTDRKTTTQTVGGYYFDRYDLDNQMSLYTFAGQVVFHAPVRGVIIDAAQIAVGFTRFARGMTHRTPAQTEEWLKDLRYWLEQAKNFALAGHWPMNEKSCFLCAFKKVCSRDPAVRQQFLESDFERRHWNPLEIR